MAQHSKTVPNERLKLLATTSNTIGVAIFVTGFIVPMVARLYGTVRESPPHWVAIGVCLTVVGVALNRYADHLLKGLVE